MAKRVVYRAWHCWIVVHDFYPPWPRNCVPADALLIFAECVEAECPRTRRHSATAGIRPFALGFFSPITFIFIHGFECRSPAVAELSC